MASFGKAARMLPLLAAFWGTAVISPTAPFVAPLAHTRQLVTLQAIAQDSHPWDRVNVENDPLQEKRGYNGPANSRRPVSPGAPNFHPINRDDLNEELRRPSRHIRRAQRPFATNDPSNWQRVNTENDPLQVQRGYTQARTHRPPMQWQPPPRPNSIHYDPREAPRSFLDPWHDDDMMGSSEMHDSFFMEPERRNGLHEPPRRPATPVGHDPTDDWRRVDVGNSDPFKAQRRGAPNNHPQPGSASARSRRVEEREDYFPQQQQQQQQQQRDQQRDDIDDTEDYRSSPQDSQPRPRQRQDSRVGGQERTSSSTTAPFQVQTQKLKEQDRRSNPLRQSVPQPIDRQEYEWTVQEILKVTNHERRRQRVHELTYNPELSKAALVHAQDMARNDYFSHKGKNGSTLADRVKGFTSYRYQTVAENLFWQAPDNDPAYAVRGWMESTTGHRDNLLSRDHSDVGIAYAYNPDNEKYYYVQVFGRPLKTPPAPRGVEPTRQVLMEVTNGARQKVGNQLPPMMLSRQLHDAAQRHAEDIARAGTLDALRDIDRYVADPQSFRRLAANVAHREPFNDPYGAMDGWLEKKNGREYILGREMTHVGVGYAQDGENHYYVQLYGSLFHDNMNGRGGGMGGGPGRGPMGFDGGPEFRGPPRGGPEFDDFRGGPEFRGPGGFGGPPGGGQVRFGGPAAQQGYGGQQVQRGYVDRRGSFGRVNEESPSNYPSRSMHVRSNRVIGQPSHHVTTGIPTADY